MDSLELFPLLNNQSHFNSTPNVDNFVDLTQKYSRIIPLGHKSYSTLIVGERGVGKTTLAKDIASKIISIHNIETNVLFTYNIWKNEYENVNTISEYNTMNLREIIKEQEKPNSKPVLIIFDECFPSNEMNDDKNIKKIILNAKLFKIFSIIITHPHHMKMKPSLRINMDLVFVFKDDANRKKIYEYFFGMLPNFNIFNSIMSSLRDYECLVVDNLHEIYTNYKLTDKLGRYIVM